MTNQVEKGLKIAGTGGILMVAEEEAEDGLVEVIAIKITLGQEMVMVVAGALAEETEAEVVVTETGMTTMREGPSVKVEAVAGLSLLTGMPVKRKALKEIKISQRASQAGVVTKMIAGEGQNSLVEMIRLERAMGVTPGIRTNHLWVMDPLSWVSGVVLLGTLRLLEEDL